MLFSYRGNVPVIGLALATTVVFGASPTRADPTARAGCDLSKARQIVPGNQSVLVVPAATVPSFVLGAVGLANYTCADTSIFVPSGALADLYDISCLVNQPYEFEHFQDATVTAWLDLPGPTTPQQAVNTLRLPKRIQKVGVHYWVPNPITGVGINPKFDFTAVGPYAGNSRAFVIAEITGDIPAPLGPLAGVDWRVLKSIQGDLATTIFRVDTRAGLPPPSCVFGLTPDIQVKYTAKHWFYGGLVNN